MKSKYLLMAEEDRERGESMQFTKLTNNNNFLDRKSIEEKASFI